MKLGKRIVVCLLCLVLLTGCETTVLEPKQSTSTYIRLATDLSKDSIAYAQLERFQKELATKTDGRWQIVLYQEDEWGDGDSMREYLRLHSVELICLSTEAVSEFVPEYAIYKKPGLFATREQVQTYTEGKQGLGALSLLQQQYQPIGWAINGYDYWVTIGTKSGWQSDGDIRKLLNKKTLQEGNVLLTPRVRYGLEVVMGDLSWWNTLSEANRQVLTETFQEALQDTWNSDIHQQKVSNWEACGLTVQNLSAEEQSVLGEMWSWELEEYFATHQDALTGQWRPITVEVIEANSDGIKEVTNP